MRPLYTAQQFLCTHAHLQQHIYPTAVDLPAAETIEVDFIRPSIEREREREVGEIYLLGGTRYINVSASSTISDTTGTTNYECFIAAFFGDRANFTDFKVDRAVKKGDRPIHLPNKRQLAWFYFMTGPHFCMKSLFFPILSCLQLISIRNVYIICSWKIYLLVFVHYSSMNSITNLNGNFPFFFFFWNISIYISFNH